MSLNTKWIYIHPNREAILANSPKEKMLGVREAAKKRTDPETQAYLAKNLQRYMCDEFSMDCAPPSYVNIYTPDGGVLRAVGEADAARLCLLLNSHPYQPQSWRVE